MQVYRRPPQKGSREMKGNKMIDFKEELAKLRQRWEGLGSEWEEAASDIYKLFNLCDRLISRVEELEKEIQKRDKALRWVIAEDDVCIVGDPYYAHSPELREKILSILNPKGLSEMKRAEADNAGLTGKVEAIMPDPDEQKAIDTVIRGLEQWALHRLDLQQIAEVRRKAFLEAAEMAEEMMLTETHIGPLYNAGHNGAVEQIAARLREEAEK